MARSSSGLDLGTVLGVGVFGLVVYYAAEGNALGPVAKQKADELNAWLSGKPGKAPAAATGDKGGKGGTTTSADVHSFALTTISGQAVEWHNGKLCLAGQDFCYGAGDVFLGHDESGNEVYWQWDGHRTMTNLQGQAQVDVSIYFTN